LIALSGCDSDRRRPATDPPATDPPASDPPASDPPASDPPASDSPASDSSARRSQANAALPATSLSVEERLSSAPLEAVSSSATGFEATLQTAEGERRVTVWLGTRRSPSPRRRAVAFSRLARELELGVVPPAVVRALPLAQVARLAQEASSSSDGALVILNDGTVPAVLATLGTDETGDVWSAPREPRSVFFATMAERAAWLEQAASDRPVDGEDPHALRAFVGALVLDFLSAHLLRRDVVIAMRATGEGATLVLADNDEAFPPHADPRGVDRLLAPLREVRRFPKALLDRLRALDRPRIDRVFDPGPFEAMLLSPRDRLELDERIKTLISLIESRVDPTTQADGSL
jgi:hypothetical protein